MLRSDFSLAGCGCEVEPRLKEGKVGARFSARAAIVLGRFGGGLVTAAEVIKSLRT